VGHLDIAATSNALRADLGPRDDEHVRLQHGVVGDGHVGGRVQHAQVQRASLLQDADQIAAHRWWDGLRDGVTTRAPSMSSWRCPSSGSASRSSRVHRR